MITLAQWLKEQLRARDRSQQAAAHAGVHQLQPRHRPSLLARSREGKPANLEAAPKRSLRRYARTLRRLDFAVALARHTRTFYQLDPTTSTWEQL